MKTLKILALLTLITPTLLLAEGENHIAVGSRPMNEEAAAQINAEKGQQVEEDSERETAGFIFDRYPPVFYSQSHHSLSAVTVLDNDKYTVEFEDGSVWKISNYDGVKALNWRSNDPLTVTQNNRWFSNHLYRIINKSNGTSVEATLFLGPIELGQYSRFITGIDHTRREILLSDNTNWEVSSRDSSVFKDWSLNDYIIIGTNSNTYWCSDSDALLINVNMNNSARGKQF